MSTKREMTGALEFLGTLKSWDVQFLLDFRAQLRAVAGYIG